jgi:restriction endonuclease S subunit
VTRPAYAEHKESGTEWLGAIPVAWVPSRLKNIIRTIESGTSVNGAELPAGPDEVGVLKTSCVSAGWFNPDANKTVVAEDIRRVTCPVRKDTLIVNRANTPLLVGSTGYVSQNLDHIYLSDKLWQVKFDTALAEFVYYWTLTAAYRSQIAAQCVGASSSMQNLSIADFRDVAIAIPPYPEQKAIVRFLAGQTTKIDSLVSKQEQLIATLQERRSITVDLILDRHGFTAPRSLPDLESATPPRGWLIIHLGTVLRQLTNGFVGPTRDILVDEGVPYVQSTHIKQGRIDFNRRPFYVRREWHDERPRIHLREGDVLIVQTGDVGKVAVVPPEFGEASCHALQIARVKPEVLTGDYLGVFLSSWIGYHYLCSLATGALHPHLEAGIRAVPVVVPPFDVQTVIVRQVSEQTAKIDALIAKATEVIDTLREYRSALITDAVTGKIDVREAA